MPPDIFDTVEEKEDIFDKVETTSKKSSPVKDIFDQVTQHPFRSILQPISKTLGGPTAAEAIDKRVGAAPFAEAEGKGPVQQGIAFAKSYGAGLVGDIFDAIQSPISAVPIPGAKLIGKIPIAKTPLSRILKNVNLDKDTISSVKNLIALDKKLASTTPLSSRGKTTAEIKKIVEKAGGKFIKVAEEGEFGYEEGNPMVYYNTPSQGTQVIKMSEFTPEKVKTKIDVFETAYKKGRENKLLESANRKMEALPSYESLHKKFLDEGKIEEARIVEEHMAKVRLTPEEIKAQKDFQAANIAAKDYPEYSEASGSQEIPPPKPPSAPAAVAPQPAGSKERGFITSVKESPLVAKETKRAIEQMPPEVRTYEPYSDQSALLKAQRKVDADPAGSLAEVLSSETPTKDTTVTGLELMRRFRESKNFEQEANIAANLAEKATTSGQFIQGFSILDKLSPEGLLVFASKEIKKGGKVLTGEFAEILTKQAQLIKNLPYGYQKVKEINKLMEMIAEQKGKSVGDWVAELANVPRTLMSSLGDFSFGFRQGAFLMPSFRKEFGAAFKKQFKAFASEKNYDDLMDSIMKHPDYELAVESGVAFTDIRTKLTNMEERFLASKIIQEIPVLGKVLGPPIEATSRAYTAMANKMRMDVFSKMAKDSADVGLPLKENPKLAKQIATFVNAGTGRGGLAGSFAKAASLLNAFFFSPRLMSSRLTLLNPAYYVTREPTLRKQALKSLFSFIGLGTTVLTVAATLGAKVGTNPTSADFGKIKIGNTRIDAWGGFSQYVRMMAQMVTGKYTSSTTGKVLTLGEGYKPLSRFDILLRQIESKEAPVFSFFSNVLKQQDWSGKPVNVAKEVGIRFVPMVVQDMYDLAQEDPSTIPLGLLSVFGFGVNTYSDKKTELVKKGIEQLKSGGKLPQIRLEIAKKLYDNPTKEQIRKIGYSLLQEQVAENNPYYNQLIGAPSNEKKIEIIREMRAKYGKEEMRNYEREMIKNKIASPEVILKSRRL